MDCLARRKFPVGELRLLASARSKGKKIAFQGKMLEVVELTDRSFEGIDIAFFSAGGSISKQYAPIAVAAGALVIDNSSAFRMDPKVPLVIPEINPEAAREHHGIIAGSRSSTDTGFRRIVHIRIKLRQCLIETLLIEKNLAVLKFGVRGHRRNV